MTTAEFISSMPVSQQALFDFHTDVTNIVKITPPFIPVRCINVPVQMKEGSRMTVEIRQLWWWMAWDVMVETLVPNSLMIDVQSGRGPFTIWRHEHHLIKKEDSVFLMDRIQYQLPFGILGKLAGIIFLRPLLKMLFFYRHKKTKEYLSKT